MSTQQGTLLDVLKKKMRQTKEEAEKYQEEAEEYRKKLQIEIRRREEVSSVPFLISNFSLFNSFESFFFNRIGGCLYILSPFSNAPFHVWIFRAVFFVLCVCVYV